MASFFDKALTLARGAAQGAMQSYGQLLRSEGGPAPTQAAANPPKSLLADPYMGLMNAGYKDKPGALQYEQLRQMVRRTPVVAAIIQTRTNQISSFASPQISRFDTGYKVTLRDSRATPSKAAQARMADLEKFISQCGVPDGHQYRDSFADYLKKVSRDSLTTGHDATEIVANRRGEPAEFLAVDATTIRLAEHQGDLQGLDPADIVRYVQVYEEQVVAEYTFGEMMFGTRMPATDLRLQGYGYCELEMLVDTVANLLNIYQYNGNFFQNNSLPRGIINLRGDVTTEMLDGFRRHWYAMLSGTENAFMTPIAAAKEGIEFLPMSGGSNNDMQMQAWHEMMVRCACAVFSISPEEIGFGMGAMGMTSSLNAPTNVDKVVEGRERGLVPLLSHFAQNINLHVISQIDEDFTFDFVGLEGQTRDQWNQQAQAQVSTIRTVDEIRAEEGLAAMPDGTGKIILNPIFVQNQMQMQQQAMQAQQAAQAPEQGGMPDDGSSPDDQDAYAPEGASDEEAQGPGTDDRAGTGDAEPLAASFAGLHGGVRLPIPGLRPIASGTGWFRQDGGRH